MAVQTLVGMAIGVLGRDCAGDVYPVAAQASPFDGAFAHGFLNLSLLPEPFEDSGAPSCDGAKLFVNAGGNRLRFIAPVRAGARIRGRFILIDLKEASPGRYKQTIESHAEIEGRGS